MVQAVDLDGPAAKLHLLEIDIQHKAKMDQ